jgi:branched-chain amino acid transport system substrate-binding protein
VRKRAAFSPSLAVLIAVASLAVATCAPVAAPSPAPVATGASVAKRVKIVSSLPLQGPSRAETVPIVNAIKMALDEQGGKAGSTTVEYESYDDASAAKQTWDPAVEAENARRATADPTVVAYIGTYNSGAARVSIPITCQANLAMVSPANTYPGLTKAYESDEPGKYYPNCKRNFARVIPADDIQGTVGARWAKELGAKRVYIVHDTEQYGGVMANAFRTEAKRIGLDEVGYEAAPKSNDFRALASKIVASGADILYYGGHVGNNPGFLLRDLRQARPAITFMGPDGLIDEAFLTQAGPKAVDAYITSCCLEVPHYTGKDREWAQRYEAKYGDRPEVHAIHGYEAAKVVLAAIAQAGSKADDRATVRDLVMGTKDFDGVSGRWSFDANGDTSLGRMSGLKVTKIGVDFESSVEFQKQLN